MKSLLQPPPSDDDFYPNDRLPSEQVIGEYVLRGYRGPHILVATRRYFPGTAKLESFTSQHAHDMARRKWPFPREIVEQDILRLEQLAEQCDAVRVIPTR